MIYFFKQLWQRTREQWDKLIRLNDRPEAIAGATAIGIIVGYTPFFSVKMLLAMAIAWALRCNKIGAAIAVNLHDIAFPLSPFIYFWSYQLGAWLLSGMREFPPSQEWKWLMEKESYAEWHVLADAGTWLEWVRTFPWTILEWARTFHWMFLVKMLVGSLLISSPMAVAAYFIVLRLVRRRQNKRAIP